MSDEPVAPAGSEPGGVVPDQPLTEPVAGGAAAADPGATVHGADPTAPGETPAADSVTPDAPAAPATELSEDAIVALIAERDEYLNALQRLKAEFANARRRSDEQASAQRRQAAADLVTKLLPILDSVEAALDQGIEAVRPLSDALYEVLNSQGLERLDPVGEPFDPEQHEAVMFEPADPAQAGGEGSAEQVVAETMRLGYVWNERVLRAAMVKVRG